MLTQLFKNKYKFVYGVISTLIILIGIYCIYQYINRREGLDNSIPTAVEVVVPEQSTASQSTASQSTASQSTARQSTQKSNTILPVQSNSSVGPPTSGELIEEDIVEHFDTSSSINTYKF
jgi:hypothetical protein